MKTPSDYHFLNRFGKILAIRLGWMLRFKFVAKNLRLLQWYLSFVEGKGAGQGWDLSGETKAAMIAVNRSNPLIFDVGANSGLWATSIYERYEGKCTIHMFEPIAQYASRLIQLKLTNSVIITAGLSDSSGIAKIKVVDGVASMSSLNQRRDSLSKGQSFSMQDVRCITLDSYVENNKLEFIDFMKMDIEGHELSALRGAQETLKNKQIGAFSFEFGIGQVNSRVFFLDIWEFMAAYDSKFYRICPGGNLMHIPEYYEDLEYFRGATNYIVTLNRKDTLSCF